MSAGAGILFDVGYCLMDEAPRLAHALGWLARALASTPPSPSAADLRAAYFAACRRPDPDEPSLLVQMLRSLGVPAETTAALRRAVPWDAAPLVAYVDAVPALRDLRTAGFRLGILANQPRSARADLDQAGITALCDDVWLSEAVGLAKPDPAFFRVALEAWRLAPDRVAYVGDRPDNDVAPARALGLTAVRLRRGPHAEQAPTTESERADFEVRDLAELARWRVAWRGALDDPRSAVRGINPWAGNDPIVTPSSRVAGTSDEVLSARMALDEERCCFCRREIGIREWTARPGWLEVDCPVCGRYRVERRFWVTAHFKKARQPVLYRRLARWLQASRDRAEPPEIPYEGWENAPGTS